MFNVYVCARVCMFNVYVCVRQETAQESESEYTAKTQNSKDIRVEKPAR